MKLMLASANPAGYFPLGVRLIELFLARTDLNILTFIKIWEHNYKILTG